MSRALQWLVQRLGLVGSMLRAMHNATNCLAEAPRKHALRVHMRIIPHPRRQFLPVHVHHGKFANSHPATPVELSPNNPG